MSSIGNPPPDIGSTERVKRPLPALPTSKNTSMPPIVQKEAEHVEELVKLEDLILQDQDANKANSHDSTPVSEHKVYNLEELMESGPVLDLDIEVSPDDVDFDALVESESQKEASEPEVAKESFEDQRAAYNAKMEKLNEGLFTKDDAINAMKTQQSKSEEVVPQEPANLVKSRVKIVNVGRAIRFVAKTVFSPITGTIRGYKKIGILAKSEGGEQIERKGVTMSSLEQASSVVRVSKIPKDATTAKIELHHEVKFSLYTKDPTDISGNVDRATCIPEKGLLYVADAVGHNYIAKGQEDKWSLIHQIWDKFEGKVRNLPEGADVAKEVDNLLALPDPNRIKGQKGNSFNPEECIHDNFEDIGKSCTFTSMAVKETNSATFVSCTAIGDSTIVAVRIKGGKVLGLDIVAGKGTADENEAAITDTELGSTVANRQQVDYKLPDDPEIKTVILAFTDGVGEFHGIPKDGTNFDKGSIPQTLNTIRETMQSILDKADNSDSIDPNQITERFQEMVLENRNELLAKGLLPVKDLDDASLAVAILSGGGKNAAKAGKTPEASNLEPKQKKSRRKTTNSSSSESPESVQSISLEPQQPTKGTRFAEMNQKLKSQLGYKKAPLRLEDLIGKEIASDEYNPNPKFDYLNALLALENLHMELNRRVGRDVHGHAMGEEAMERRNAALAFAEQLGNWAKNNPNEEINSETEGLKKFPFDQLNLGDEQTLEVLNQAAQATLAMMQEP